MDMWPFGKPKTLRQLEIERFPELVRSIAQTWPTYLAELDRNGFGRPELVIQFGTFGVRAAEALRKTHFGLRRSPDSYFMLAVTVGVIQSGKYERWEVEDAAGFEIPLRALIGELNGTEY